MSVIKAAAIAALVVAGTSSAYAHSTGDAETQTEVTKLIDSSSALRTDNLRVQVIDNVVYVHGIVDTQAEEFELKSLLSTVEPRHKVEVDVNAGASS